MSSNNNKRKPLPTLGEIATYLRTEFAWGCHRLPIVLSEIWGAIRYDLRLVPRLLCLNVLALLMTLIAFLAPISVPLHSWRRLSKILHLLISPITRIFNSDITHSIQSNSWHPPGDISLISATFDDFECQRQAAKWLYVVSGATKVYTDVHIAEVEGSRRWYAGGSRVWIWEPFRFRTSTLVDFVGELILWALVVCLVVRLPNDIALIRGTSVAAGKSCGMANLFDCKYVAVINGTYGCIQKGVIGC